MEFYEYVTPTEGDKKEGQERPPNSMDSAADKLENGIEKAYEKLSTTDWGSLWSSVRKQGELAISAANTAVADVKAKAESLISPVTEGTAEIEKSGAEGVVADKPKASAMLRELTKKAQDYIDELDQDIEELENAAGSYLSKVGTNVKSLLRDAVAVDAPGDTRSKEDIDIDAGEDASSEVLFNVPEDIRNQIYSTRLDAQLHALHTSTQPFLTTSDEPQFIKFVKDEFKLDSMTETIAGDLEKFPSLRKLMESLVPDKVPYDQFWAKYYYMIQQIREQELKRKKLLERATTAEENVSWDDEDEEDDEEVTPKASSSKVDNADNNKASRPSSSDASYDLVSKTSAVSQTDEDEDDDWE